MKVLSLQFSLLRTIMSRPFFSVILPVLNNEKTVSETLNGILNQTFRDFEIIFADGLSQDDSCLIAKRFGDSRIKILSGKDAGVYDAMNKGIRAASGEWLFFIGAGDFLVDKNVLQDVFSSIKSAPMPDVVYGDVKIKGSTGWAEQGTVYDGRFSIKKLLDKNICHQSIFYKRNVFDITGDYNLRYKVCSDYDLNLKCFAWFECLYIDRIIAVFDAGGISTNGIDEEFGRDFYDNIFDYYRSKLFRKDFRKCRKAFLKYGIKKLKEQQYGVFFRMLLLRLWHAF